MLNLAAPIFERSSLYASVCGGSHKKDSDEEAIMAIYGSSIESALPGPNRVSSMEKITEDTE